MTAIAKLRFFTDPEAAQATGRLFASGSAEARSGASRGWALGASLAGLALLLPWESGVSLDSSALLAAGWLAVLVSALVGGPASGLAATLVSALALASVRRGAAFGGAALPDLRFLAADALAGTGISVVAGVLRSYWEDHRRARRDRGALVAAHQASLERLSALQALTCELGRAVTSRQVAEVALRAAMEASGAARVALYRLAPEARCLQLDCELALTGATWPRPEQIDLTAADATASVARAGEPVFLPSLEERARLFPDEPEDTVLAPAGARAELPLLARDRVVGVLALSFRHARPFGEPERSLLVALAGQCAQALDRAELHEREQQARVEAETANRLKDEFLTTLSHELRTPLNAILGWASVLRQMGDGETMGRALDTIERNAQAQDRLIGDLLEVSRIASGTLRVDAAPVDLVSMAAAAAESARPSAEAKGIRLVIDSETPGGPVMADRPRIQQVIDNLVSNAIKFTPAGGTVQMRASCRGSNAELSVSDTGIGMSPDVIDEMFLPFRQADSSITRSQGGLGVGLAFARQVAELHGGTVEGKSSGPGQGSTFILRLPLLADKDAHAPAAAMMAEAKSKGGPDERLSGVRVLLVEDEADLREALAVVLQGCGAVVDSASGVTEALALLDRTRPQVVLADIAMPGEDGFALIRQIRQRPGDMGGNVPAVALTGYARPEDRMAVLMAGYQMHVAKPVQPAELVAVICGLVGATPQDSGQAARPDAGVGRVRGD
jgi:signal transduction histidine kinase/ActR/RegA family two-component response regulator